MHEETSFDQKLQLVKETKKPIAKTRLWFDMIVYSLILFIVVSGYYLIQRGSFSLALFNQVIADVGMLLMGLSFALSGICYFWNFADHYIIYRKQLGVVGFAYVILHGLISLFFIPENAPILFYYLEKETILAFISAFIAISIYTMMVIVSTDSMIHKLGGHTWRILLRVGYIAYVFSLLHMWLNSYPFWLRYLTGQGRSPLPSFGLLTFLVGVFVIVLRLAVWISTSRKKEMIQSSSS
ncbi:hypothetical protein A3A93_00030 [Candidatus Roizmanbacteria bacterium RIFCSPLOWO2_01_FULL_38_12]|uniref:Uncharacterized protein n=1 Tax=Candidatus Roizmanbacteria bacterium RIFCSPLOWO2_01_FULL_38_12 TaxID=1802061 RepID=A0A1F7J0W5_9BACT|nr:MAG: hypothetical protein A2861_00810 [Candidatus Roizmanbacteria bacterium RIFCSPHIGHO2_01_FULL_38_15]OGK34715.1 MAG: hypothetical protein A3F59_01175 [Candidatus Roizmanbacteria bacterium RIFCSPHIGHO2_12_FULL_38_13]OGK49256.1 MAG: hypothetical protein A3A93_00030 [Candidatus Roizmanbacteria bacterium RIFCSPLOWO2_01_FULL_38_12]